jgi:hypothetical protein
MAQHGTSVVDCLTSIWCRILDEHNRKHQGMLQGMPAQDPELNIL